MTVKVKTKVGDNLVVKHVGQQNKAYRSLVCCIDPRGFVPAIISEKKVLFTTESDTIYISKKVYNNSRFTNLLNIARCIDEFKNN